MDGVRKRKQKKPTQKPVDSPRTSTSRSFHRKNKSAKKISIQSSRTIQSVLPFFKKWYRPIGVFIITGILIWAVNYQSHTDVVIEPHLSYVPFQESITLYDNPNQDQLGFEIIALTGSEETAITATETRAVESFAAGTVTIVNEFSTEPQRLLPNTRFQSASGSMFILGKQEVIIPGKTDAGPGTITAEIFAANPGEQYNIDATDFSIIGFKEAGLTDKFNTIYASSSTAFSGGFIGTEPFLGEGEKLQATNELTESLTNRLQERLIQEKTERLVLIDNSLEMRIEKVNVQSAETENTATLEINGTLVALAVGKKELAEYINVELQKRGDIDNQKLKNIGTIDIKLNQSSIDFDTLDSAIVIADMSPLYVSLVDNQLISQQLQGLGITSVDAVLDAIPTIDRAEITINPFWKKTLSSDANDISISYKQGSYGSIIDGQQ